MLKVIKKMTLNFKGTLFDLSSPKVMGIINITPDSFYDGGGYLNDKDILDKVGKMLESGADIIDLGGYSTRPGAKNISIEQEEKRTIPIVKLILKTFKSTIISIDTFRSEVAKKALDNGALIVNDVSGGDLDSNMYKTVGKFNVPYIMMHMKGSPKYMQNNPKYKNVTVEVIKNLSQKIRKAESFNINDIVIDPGFGFGKTTSHNFKLLNDLSLFKNLNRPVMVGISRKSMIYKTLNFKPENALNGTTSLNTIALLNGANILRVHDVKEAKEVIKLYNYLKKNA